MNNLYLEQNSVKVAFAPVDAAVAQTGARLSMKETKNVAFVLALGAGAGSNIVASLDQHDAASGGTSKALNIKANVYYKLNTDTVFTKIEKRPDDETLSDEIDLSTEIGANPATVIIEVVNDHLDAQNGFDHVSLNLEAAGAAKLASCTMHLLDAAHKPAYDLAL